MTHPGVRLIGAGYVAAVLAGDELEIQRFRIGYGPRLLYAVETQIIAMGHRLAVAEDKMPADVGEALISAATIFEHLEAQNIDPLNPENYPTLGAA